MRPAAFASPPIRAGGGQSAGWDFAGTGRSAPVHPLGVFDNGPGSFSDRFTWPDPVNTGRVRAVNPDTFVLLSAGKDGIYGTDDDIGNTKIQP